MSSLMIKSHITLNVSRPNNNVIVYAKQYDKDSRTVDIKLVDGASVWDPPESCEMVVMYTKPDGTLGVYDQLEDNSTPAVTRIGTGEVLLTLAEQALTVAGNVLVEISFYTADLRSTTLSFMLSVESAVPKNEILESDNYFNILSELIQGLLGATTNPPQIDSVTKNWMLWNQTLNRYEVSDYSSVGTKGDKGDQGWSIVSVTPASGSGTHPKGGYDTYEVKTNNSDASQQLIATFQVYNGDDGEGAPGTITPLKDNAVPQIGSSPAFAREDHVHPAVTPGDIGAVSLSELVDLIYPVGSIYMSVNNVSPETFLGGEWEQIEDKFLLGSGELYEPGSEGGESSVTLTTSHLPAHTHGSKYLYGTIRFNDKRIGGNNTQTTGIVSYYSSSTTQYFNTSTSSNVANITGFNFNATHEHDSVGENQPHNNMPPYLVVYMWKRTA